MRFGKKIQRLFDIDVDEISLVDRPANQHGLVAISKRAEDDMPELYDIDTGESVAEEELQHGDRVEDADGNELVYFEEGSPEYQRLADEVDSAYDDDENYDGDDAYDTEGEYAEVGKAGKLEELRRGARMGYSYGGSPGRGGAEGLGERLGGRARRARSKAGEAKSRAVGSGAAAYGAARGAGRDFAGGYKGQRGGSFYESGTSQRAGRFGAHVARNRAAYAGGGAVAAGGGAYETQRRVRKSLGEQVYEDLSKALTDDDRDQAIAKALSDLADRNEDLAERNAGLVGVVGKMLEERDDATYSQLAEAYDLPVDSGQLGAVLKRASRSLSPEDLGVLDRILTAASETNQHALYSEIGKSGPSAYSDTWDQVEALTEDIISKSDLTREQARSAVFDANPDAYDAFLAESTPRF